MQSLMSKKVSGNLAGLACQHSILFVDTSFKVQRCRFSCWVVQLGHGRALGFKVGEALLLKKMSRGLPQMLALSFEGPVAIDVAFFFLQPVLCLCFAGIAQILSALEGLITRIIAEAKNLDSRIRENKTCQTNNGISIYIKQRTIRKQVTSTCAVGFTVAASPRLTFLTLMACAEPAHVQHVRNILISSKNETPIYLTSRDRKLWRMWPIRGLVVF